MNPDRLRPSSIRQDFPRLLRPTRLRSTRAIPVWSGAGFANVVPAFGRIGAILLLLLAAVPFSRLRTSDSRGVRAELRGFLPFHALLCRTSIHICHCPVWVGLPPIRPTTGARGGGRGLGCQCIPSAYAR